MPLPSDLIPPLLLAAPFLIYFFARLLQYLVLRALGRQVPVDQEMLTRGESVLLGQPLKQVFVLATDPVLHLLERAKVRPNTLSLLAFAISLATGALIAAGATALGGVAGTIGSAFDYFDGRVARRSGRVSKAGAFLDSTLDRYSDIAFFGGAAVLFRHSAAMLAICLLALGSAVLVSYTRAKAESLGAPLTVGLMQRAERIVLFCAGAFFGPYLDPLLPADLQGKHLVFGACICVLAVLTGLTTAHRTVAGFAALSQQDLRHSTAEPSRAVPHAGEPEAADDAASPPPDRRPPPRPS